jgi:hypothetical protein
MVGGKPPESMTVYKVVSATGRTFFVSTADEAHACALVRMNYEIVGELVVTVEIRRAIAMRAEPS